MVSCTGVYPFDDVGLPEVDCACGDLGETPGRSSTWPPLHSEHAPPARCRPGGHHWRGEIGTLSGHALGAHALHVSEGL